MLFDDWNDLGRIILVGTATYLALIAILRVSGKRTLSKLNAFDLVVTVSIGSTLATVLLNKSIALAEGIVALALLVFLQFAVAWLSVRSQALRGLVKAEPTLLAREGLFLDGAMRRERVTRDEVLAAVRAQGHGDLSGIAAVVLETDGSISVLTSNPRAPGAPAGVRRADVDAGAE